VYLEGVVTLRALVVVGLVAGAGALACRDAPEPIAAARPSVLLVTIETLRADHVGAYGYARNTTPNLDRLAAQGARFHHAIAQAPFTLPSVASILTGKTPPEHGVRNHPAVLAPEIETLAERFRAAGYQTAAMTRHTWLRRKSGLDQGFDEYHNNKFSAGLDARSLSLAATDWLEAREPNRPFFLWLHFLDPHLPYTPSFPYSVLFREDEDDGEPRVEHLRSMLAVDRDGFEPTPYADIPGGPYYDLVFPHYPKNPALLDLAFWRRSRGSIFFGGARYDDRAVAELRDLYDGAIAYTDDNLARVLRSLTELGLDETTVVAVAGDHGEAFGEHELYFTHDFTLYDEVLRVPLVLRYPPAIEPGTEIAQQVRLMDLAPTLLELTGIDPESLGASQAVSLAPLAGGGSLPFLNAYAESAPRRRMFPEHERVYFDGNRGKWRMVRTDQWKLIRIPHPDGDRYELYDLVNDPEETANRFDELPGEAGKLIPVLEGWMRADPARDADASTEEDAELEGLDPAAEQQLKTLGYIH
jgi:arylsulfatase A-like enzyme